MIYRKPAKGIAGISFSPILMTTKLDDQMTVIMTAMIMAFRFDGVPVNICMNPYDLDH